MNYRDTIQKLTNAEIIRRIELAECVILDGIKELAGETSLKRVIKQKTDLIAVLKDRSRKKQKPAVSNGKNIVIGMKALNLFSRRL